MRSCLRFVFAALLLCAFSLPAVARADDSVHTQISTGRALKKISNALKKGLKIPSVSGLVNSSSTSAHSASIQSESDLSILTYSGLPPALTTIPNFALENLFWRPGVVDAIASGDATPEQCEEFFSSDVDGHSGGLGSCHLAEGVGQTFQTLLDAETSLCYMKSMPTKKNLKSGGIEIVKGRPPENDISKLFAPGRTTRLIKVTVPKLETDRGQAETLFISIAPLKENRREDKFYEATLYFCPDGQTTARGYNIISVSDQGELSLSIGNAQDPFGGGSHLLSVQGKLTPSGRSTSWDTSQTRTAMVQAMANVGTFKSEFAISPDSSITLKRRDAFQGNVGRDYAITHYSGTDVTTVGFLEGAFKGISTIGEDEKSFSGAAEYRDPLYASAPNNELKTAVDAYDISADEFYSTAPSFSIDTSAYSCSATANIELVLTKNDTLQEALAPCFQKRLQNMQFCRQSPKIHQAEQNFVRTCRRGNGP